MFEYSSPCKNCDNRSPICHSTCEKYIIYRTKLNERNENIRKQRERESIVPLYGGKK